MDPIVPTQIETDDQNEIAIIIDGQRFRLWKGAEIKLSMDSIDTFSFGGPFQSDVPDYRLIFQPLSFKKVSAYIGGEIFFNGNMTVTTPAVDPDQRTFSVSGYSLPGVLNDCPHPVEAYPLEYNKVNLNAIASRSAGFFGVTILFEGNPGAVFDRVKADSSEKVLSFLNKLAHERNLITTNSLDGSLKFYSPTISAPVTSIRQGSAPYISASPNYNAQNFFSSITGLAPTNSIKNAERFTLVNPFLSTVIRPFVFQVQDAKSADLQSAVRSKMGRMFGDAISFNLTVQGWRDQFGQLWKPNTIINFQSDDAMVYNETQLLIRSVSFKREDSDIASFNLVLPESYQGKIPGSLPWLV